jgi:hypothetical protein
MALFIAQAVLVGMLWFGFLWLNRRKTAQRVAVGKPAKIIDRSMLKKIDREDVFDSQKGAAPLTNADLDLTDLKNDEVRRVPACFASIRQRQLTPYSSPVRLRLLDNSCPPWPKYRPVASDPFLFFHPVLHVVSSKEAKAAASDGGWPEEVTAGLVSRVARRRV